MKKNIKKFLGISLFILGIFFIVVQPFSTMTGAVIDLTTTFNKIYFGIGLALIVIGTLLVNFNQQ